VIDVPRKIFIGIILETIGSRRGEMPQNEQSQFRPRPPRFSRFPSRGLIGLRSQLLTDTRGTALIHSIFDGWMGLRRGKWPCAPTGALVADRAGVPPPHLRCGIFQERGELFIGPRHPGPTKA